MADICDECSVLIENGQCYCVPDKKPNPACPRCGRETHRYIAAAKPWCHTCKQHVQEWEVQATAPDCLNGGSCVIHSNPARWCAFCAMRFVQAHIERIIEEQIQADGTLDGTKALGALLAAIRKDPHA